MRSKLVPGILGIVFLVSLGGCVNLFHHIQLSDDGSLEVRFKAGMPKPLLSMMDDSGEGAPEELGLEEIQEELAPNVTITDTRTIDNQVEYAAEVTYRVPNGSRPDADMVPSYDGETLTLPMAPSQGEAELGGGELDEMAMAFFSTAKHSIILEKANLPPIRTITLTVDGQETELPYTELPHNYLIEYPLSLVLFAQEGGVLQIHFSRGVKW